MLKTVLYAEKGEGNQAMLIAGSGTLGWDSVGANLIERGDDAVSEAIDEVYNMRPECGRELHERLSRGQGWM